MKRTHYTALCGLLILTLSGCGTEDDTRLGTGNFEAEEILVSSETSGKVLEWTLSEGDTIAQGEAVGLIDTTQLFLQKQALLRSGRAVTSGRPSVETQTAALETKLNDLEAQRRRVEKLVAGGAATQKQLDDILTGIALTKDQIAATRSTLTKSNAQITAQSSGIDIQVAQVEDLIKRSVITSPISGTVLGTYTKAGELTGQGAPLFRVADLSEMTLRAYLTGEALSSIKLGDTVPVRVDNGDGFRDYEGKVTWISSESEFTPKTVQTKDERTNLVYAVKIRVPNDGYLRIGMYGEVLRTSK